MLQATWSLNLFTSKSYCHQDCSFLSFQILERMGVFLCGFEPLKSVLLFLLKVAPGKLSVCSPALASGDVKRGMQLFIGINRKKNFILNTAKSLQRLLFLC